MNTFKNELREFPNKKGKLNNHHEKLYEEEEAEMMFKKIKDATVTFDSDLLFFCDSNGGSIDEDTINKSLSCKKLFCPKYTDIIDIINKSKIICQPQQILVMAGTNDFKDGDTLYVIQNIDILFDTLRKKFPGSKIVVSSVLPRKRFDPLNREVKVLNKHLEEKCNSLPKCTYMDNNHNINSNLLCGSVHLNEAGTFKLINNIKFYLFGQIEFPKPVTKKEQGGYRLKNIR